MHASFTQYSHTASWSLHVPSYFIRAFFFTCLVDLLFLPVSTNCFITSSQSNSKASQQLLADSRHPIVPCFACCPKLYPTNSTHKHMFFSRGQGRDEREKQEQREIETVLPAITGISATLDHHRIAAVSPSSKTSHFSEALICDAHDHIFTFSGENQPPQHSARGTYVISHHVSMRGSRVTTTPSATPRPGSTSQYPRNTPKPIRSDVCQSVPSSTLQVSRRPSIELSAPRYMMPDRNQAWCFGAVSLLGFNATSPLSSAPRIRQRHTVQSCPRWIRGDIITSKNVLEFFPSLLILIFSS